MTRIAVTGAAGSVGRATLDALDEYDVTPLTHRPHDDIDGTVFEVADYEETLDALDGHDVVVHLAGNPSPEASWDGVFETNIGGTYNVYEAARQVGVDRVVFASTNHVAQMYNIDDESRPETLRDDTTPVFTEDVPRPDSYYAVSKVSGEALGSYYADRHDIEVVNTRIGWLLTPEELREVQEKPESEAHYARAMWLSEGDWADAVRKAVSVDLPSNPLTVNVTSRNTEGVLSLIETRRHLGYEPRDDSSEVVERD